MKHESQSNAREWQMQEQALEQLRREAPASGDPRVDGYRLAFHAVVRAPQSQPPEDFTAAVVRAVREAEVDEHIERWMIRVAGLTGLACLFVFAGPMVLDSLRSSALLVLPTSGLLSGFLSSPLLWAAAAGAAAAAGLDSMHQYRAKGH